MKTAANSKLEIGVTCKASVEELQQLSPQQLQAFLRGIGEVLAAEKVTQST